MFPLGIGSMNAFLNRFLKKNQNKTLKRSPKVFYGLSELKTGPSLRGRVTTKKIKANCCTKSFVCFLNVFKK